LSIKTIQHGLLQTCDDRNISFLNTQDDRGGGPGEGGHGESGGGGGGTSGGGASISVGGDWNKTIQYRYISKYSIDTLAKRSLQKPKRQVVVAGVKNWWDIFKTSHRV